MGQAGAALGAAAGQHLAAIAGGHTLAEAVLLGALTLFGLIGTKHGGHLLITSQAGSPGPTTALLQAAVCGFASEKQTATARSSKDTTIIIADIHVPCQPHFCPLDKVFLQFFSDCQHLVAVQTLTHKFCGTL